ncbi:MAG: hypothetical protein SAJ37_03140 [Oscillatoria sp. PMC 1068.18]|nr:hypothetical protein [Oscillatoria sp. PMC 1076.18]MEC4987720.1 hypothetical protein [Oscillatoria sp. PMC 1068.18]
MLTQPAIGRSPEAWSFALRRDQYDVEDFEVDLQNLRELGRL